MCTSYEYDLFVFAVSILGCSNRIYSRKQYKTSLFSAYTMLFWSQFYLKGNMKDSSVPTMNNEKKVDNEQHNLKSLSNPYSLSVLEMSH